MATISDTFDNIAGYWELNETSGTRLDQSGNGNDLTDNNTVGSATTAVGVGADFELSNNEYLSRTNADCSAGLKPSGTTDLSFAFFYTPESNPSVTGTANRIISKDKVAGGVDRSYIVEHHNTANKLRWMYFNSSNALTRFESSVSFTAGNTYCIVCTMDTSAATATLYYGLVGTDTSLNIDTHATLNSSATSIDGSAGAFEIGADTLDSGRYIDGVLQKMLITNDIISSTEANTFYNAGNGLPYSSGFKTAAPQSGKVPSSQSNMPLYVDLSDVGVPTLTAARSIRVYADASKTTELAREIVSATEMHVKVPTVNVGQSIYIDWDGVSSDYATTATYGRNNVWTGYVSVWHMNENDTTRVDSTGNNDMPQFNSVLSGTGQIGNGADFERSSNEYLRITDASQTGLDMPGDFTLQTWYQLETASIVQVFASKSQFPTIGMQWYLDGTNKLFIFASSNNATSQRSAWSTTAAIPTSGLHLHHLTFDTTPSTNPTVGFYIDGSSVAGGVAWASSMLGSMSNNTNSFAIGSEPGATTNSFDGILDEMRIYTGILSADWITTEYNNQSDATTFWGTWTDAGGATAPFRNSNVFATL